ncbi:carboxylesterase 5A-like isoform X2 [Pseudophryne corroboree]|uniref:carboxylesterase 5A-like isoform X2 n=1 Tax=Pseudophryne corroboree TaxID=495146 RepID=UPI003081390A
MGFLIRCILLFCIIQAAHAAAGAEDDGPLVNTKYGSLRGRTLMVKKTNRTVHGFFGVPFAQPPVGPLRFQKPEPPRPWSSVKDASKHSAICPQSLQELQGMKDDFKGNLEIPPVSEDCLYLNVFTLADREENLKLPVMVFIHPGGLITGSSIQFEASALSAYESVVVVTIQYRLGLLGFFSTGDEAARGNYGLLDQVAALQWVQENIKDFGGDPQSVTIFGQSAGGVSVSALVLSPLASGLFHRAIAESGVALLPGLYTNKPVDVSIQNTVVNISGCHPDAVVECLKKKTAKEILAISSAMHVIFPICVDGVVLPKPVEEILAGHGVSPVPFIIGVNEQEFGWLILRNLNLSGLADGMDMDTAVRTLRILAPIDFIFTFMPLVMEEYFGNTNDPHEIRDRFVDLTGDAFFVIPALKTANYHRDAGHPVFFYEFQHRPSLFHDTKPDFVKADHSDEVIFVSGAPFSTGQHVYKRTPMDLTWYSGRHMTEMKGTLQSA